MLIFLFSCDNTFKYSPYMAQVDEDVLATTNINLQAIKNSNIETDTFQFAFITDTHYHYDNLKTVIEDINKQENIQFVIIGGDFTHHGLLKEYQLFHNIMKGLKTVIGDHDYLSNGEVIYKQTFVIAHFPPYAGQFDEDMYKLIMQNNDVQLSIHGHVRCYYFGDSYEDDVAYLTSPPLENPTYTVINIYDDSYDIELRELYYERNEIKN